MKYVLITILLAFSPYLKKHELGLKLQVGETYTQHHVSKNTITQTINGVEQTIEMEVTGGMNFKVRNKESNKYSIDVSYSSLIMKLNSPMGEMSFSSESGNDLFSMLLKNIVNKDFKVEMLKNGTIDKIYNMDHIFDSMFEQFPDMPDAQKNQMMGEIKKSFGEKAFKGNMEMISAIYPNKEVKTGDSWKNMVKIESAMSSFLDNTFMLKEVGSEQIIIEGTTVITTEKKDANIEINGMKTRYDLSGKMSSEYRVDPKTNWIIQGTIEQEISGDVIIGDNSSTSENMIIPMVMINHISFQK